MNRLLSISGCAAAAWALAIGLATTELPAQTQRLPSPAAEYQFYGAPPMANGVQIDDYYTAGPPLPAGAIPLQSTGPGIMPATYPRELTEPLLPEPAEATPAAPPGTKTGVFQQIEFTETWLPRGDTGFGTNDLALETVFAFPLLTRESPLIIVPAAEVHFLDGPTVPDLPPRLYDASVQIRHLRKLTPRLGVDLAITPGWHGDFEENAGRTFRLPARALGVFDWTLTTQAVAGLVYLDREDVSFLPAAGIIWKPNDDTRLELIVPRPRIARRFLAEGWIEQWWYVAGELGGGSYGIQRLDGTPDVATLSDLRLIFGLEHKNPCGWNARYEIGYVFNRSIDYLSGTPEFEPDDTVMLRAGAWY